jgi:phage tail sheath gpL-like
MSVVSNPVVSARLLPADVFTTFEERVCLLIGQQTAAATATSGQLYTNVQDKTVAQIEALFGAQSELTNRILQFRVSSKNVVRLDIIPIDDAGAAVQATGTVDFTGSTATEDGTITVNVVDKYAFSVTLQITSGDDAIAIGDALVSAIGSLTNIPVTAVNTTGSVALTASNGGTVGNAYGIEIDGDVAGVTVAITGFASGATNPTITSAIFDVVQGQRYTGIGWPGAWVADVDILTDFLDSRFITNNETLDGQGFVGVHDTKANIDSLLSTIGNKHVVVVGGNNVVNTATFKGPVVLKPADYSMAYFMGARARRLTLDSDISDLVVSVSGIYDLRGGAALASLPYFNTVDKLAAIAEPQLLYTFAEQQDLENSGFTVIGTDRTRTKVVFGPVVTPYTLDSLGNPNESFHYLNYLDTGSVCREILLTSAKSRFAQSRLTTGDTIAGRNMDNAASIKAHYLSVYRRLAENALVEAGSTAERYVAENTTVEINKASRAVSVYSVLPLVTQIGSIDYTLQFVFNY